MNNTAKTGRILYWVLSVVVVVLALRWVPFGVERAIPEMAYHLQDRKLLLYVHMTASVVPMALIPFQMWTGFRLKYPNLHRIMGRIALAGVFLGGTTLIPLAMHINIPSWGRAGFILAGGLWLGSASIGLYFILRRNLRLHRWWMMITATIIFGAATQRLMLPVYIVMGFPFKTAYSLTSWSALIINLSLFFGWQYRHSIKRKFKELLYSAIKVNAP